MKGTVFTEFLDFVDERYSPDITEEMLIACDLPSKGAYTATHTYDHSELLALVGELARRTDEVVPALVSSFGQHQFTILHSGLPQELKRHGDLFSFLESVDAVIHTETRKLYPDASLPEIHCRRLSASRLEVSYRSACPFSDLALGLLEGSASQYAPRAVVVQVDGHATSHQATFLVQLPEGTPGNELESDDEA